MSHTAKAGATIKVNLNCHNSVKNIFLEYTFGSSTGSYMMNTAVEIC